MQRIERPTVLAALLAAGSLAGVFAVTSGAFQEDRRAPWSPPKLDIGVDLSKITLPVGSAPAPVAAPTANPIGPQPAGAAGAGAHPTQAPSTGLLGANFEGPDGALAIAPGGEAHDFGSLVQGAVVEHTFRLTSAGEHPLIIASTKQSCGCTLATTQRVTPTGERVPYVFGEEIVPGESLEITVRLNTEGKKNLLNSTVTIFSNDPARTHQLRLTADVQPFFAFEPNAYINFGRMFANETKTEQVRVTSPVVDRFKLEVSRDGLPEHLDIELRPIEPDADGRAAAWDVVATILPGAPDSPSQNFPLRLSSDVPVEGAPALPDGSPRMQSAICYAVAQVVGLVSASPYYVSFGLVRPGQELERSFTIEIADDEFEPGDMPVTIVGRQPQDEALLADRLTWSVEPVGGDPRKLEVRLTLADLPDSYTGPFGGNIEVAVGHPTKPTLAVPFSGVVRTNVVRPQPPAAQPGGAAGGAAGDAAGSTAGGSR